MNRAALFAVGCCAAFMAGRVSTQVAIPWPVIPPIVVTDPVPVPGDGQHIAIIYESQDRPTMPAGQREILDSMLVRQWLKEGQWETRWFDDDVEFTNESEWFKGALSVPRESVPWIIISNGTTGYTGPLPATVDELKTLVGRYAP